MAINTDEPQVPAVPISQPASIIPDKEQVDPGLAKYQAAIGAPAKSTPVPPKGSGSSGSKEPSIDDYTKALNSDDPISPVLKGEVGEQDPTKYGFNMKPGLDNDLLRAQNQSWEKQVGLGLVNLVPNIATGIGESIGQLGTLMQFGDDRNYSNALTETMQKWHNPFGEIYAEHPNAVADLGDSAWWINNASSLIEMAGQFAALGDGLGTIFEKGALAAGDLLGSARLTKALLGAGQVATSGALSYTIGASMGAQVYQQAYQTNYNRLRSSGLSHDESDTQAKHVASQAAASTVQLNTALGFGLNLTSVLPVFKQSDEVIDFLRDGEGAIKPGETPEVYKSRLQALGEDSPELKRVTGQQTLGDHLIEGGKQAAEMAVMHWAKQSGIREGNSGQTEGFLQQFDQLGNLLGDITSSQGIMNAILGVAGGVLNTAVLERIPMHRDFVRQGGDNVPVMNEDGTPKTDEESSPIYQTKLYNSRDFARNQRMQYFENARDAVVSDLTHISSKLDNLKSLSASGKTIEMQSEMNDLLAVQQLHSITMGLGENLVGQYQEISATDNHTDLGIEAAKQADGIADQQKQLLEQAGVQDPADLKPEDKSQFDQLDAQRKQLLTQSVSLSGVSDAMQKGFTTSMKDNSYKERADQASKDVLTYQKWHQDLTRTFGFDLRNAEAHVPEMVLHKMIQSNLYQRLISKLDTENGAQRLEIAAQSGLVLSTDNFNSIVQEWNRKVSQNSRVGNSFNEDIKALHKAVEDKNGTVVEGMLAKYKIDYPQGDHITGINELTKKLADLRDTKWQQSKDAEESLGESIEFQAWEDKPGNEDRSLPDYIAELNRRTLTNDLLSQKEEYTEQLRGEHQILNDQINDIKSKPRKYAKSVLQDYDDAQKKLNDRVKAENQTFFDKDREDQAADNVTIKQKQAALKVYHTKVSDLDEQISLREEALKGMVGKETSKLGRLISWVKDPQEKSTRQEIANLQAQRDFFRDKIASIILTSDTPEQAESEGELTAIPDHIVELVNSQAGQVNSQLTPDQIRTQIGKVLQNEGIDIATITPESIDALTIRALASNKTASEHDNSETLNTLDDLINSTGNPQLVRETIDNILDEKEPFSYDALKMHQLMGFVDQPTAAKIMDHVNDLVNGSAKVTDVNTSTPPEPTLADIVTEADSTPTTRLPVPDPSLIRQDTPDPGDTTIEPPDDPTPAPDAPSDLPAAGRNIQLGGKPMFHVGSQSVSALKINRLDIAYQTDMVNENEYKMRSMSSLINRTLSDQMLRFGKIKVGDKVTLTVDKEWKGNRNIDTTPNSQTADSADLYFDKNGKIPLAQGLINEVPIKITVNGETQGYLPRMGWVLAKYEGAENYRNIATQVDEHGNVINDAEMQAERLAAVREHVVKFFNSGSKDIETTIIDRTPAHLIMNVDEKGILDPKPAKDMLPDKSLELGIVDNGLVKTSRTTTSDKELGMTANDSQWMSQGAPVAVVPMPNGKHATAPLLNRSIEQHEINTMLQLIKSYLTGDGKIQAKVKELTGFDISNAAELRNLINQHYTYTQRFAKSVLQTSMAEDATPRFMFNITNEAGHQKSEISVGTAYSGRDKMVASMTNDGQLHPEFVRQFTEGMKGRFKNIVFEDNQRGLKGLNSEGKLNEIVATKTGIKLRATHDSYNDYVKSFSDSPVNGTNTLSTGEHVYGVHSNTTLDMQGIMESRPDGKESAKASTPPLTGAEIAVPKDTTKASEPTKETKEPAKPNFSQEDADLLGEGFMDSLPNFDKPGLTLESLRDLHTFTPDEEHNGRTPQEVLAELQKMGITKLPPNFNPFKEC